MQDMYHTYGYYKEGLSYITLEGAEGAEKIVQIMKAVREDFPKTIGNEKVYSIRDYLKQREINLETNTESKINLNKSDVLYFTFENHSFCCLRPSGTEPKIKLYVGVKADTAEQAEKRLQNIKEGIEKYF